MTEDNKNIKILKDELWIRRISVEAKVVIIRKNQVVTVLFENIAKIYRDNIQKIHRVLQKILSDRRSQFASKFIKDLTKALETKSDIM